MPSDRRMPSISHWKPTTSSTLLGLDLCLSSRGSVLQKDCGWGRHPKFTCRYHSWDEDPSNNYSDYPSSEGETMDERSTGPYHWLTREEEGEEDSDQRPGPPTRRSEVRKIKQKAETTQSLSSSELRDIWKDYSCQSGEHMLPHSLNAGIEGPTVSCWEVKKLDNWSSSLESKGLRKKLEKKWVISFFGLGSSQE